MLHRIEKQTATYADVLHAIGAASLLEELGFTGVTIRNLGHEFSLETASDLPPHRWLRPSPGFPYIWEASKESLRPELSWVLDYEDARRKREAWLSYQKELAKSRGRQKAVMDAQGVQEPPKPPPELQTAAVLASMRKGWNGDRELATWIVRNPESLMQWVAWGLGISPRPPRGIPKVTNSQLLNPIAGKGVHAPKTELRSAGSIPPQLVDPFAEWMKIRGLWNGMLLYRHGNDFKCFALEPANITVGGIKLARDKLQDLNLWGGVRLDIEASLRCTEVLILHSDVVQQGTGSLIALRSLTPRAVIAGLRQAYFKSLGTAAALMNDAAMPLPEWFRIDTREDARDYLDIIEEAIGTGQVPRRTPGCLGSLDETRSDDGRILQQFRQWLLTGDLQELLDFHHCFALHLIQRMAGRLWCRPFAVLNLDKLLTKAFSGRSDVKKIIQDEGFKSIARAVRNCTIYALSLQNREVRFGLAQKWKQKMRAGHEEFLAEVSEFIQDQNWEVMHRLKGQGHVVQTEHLDSLVRLVGEHGSQLVGALLLAYGYARAPKVEGDQPLPETESQQN